MAARVACSLDAVFQVLCLGVEEDITRRNEQITKNATPFGHRYDDGGDLVVFIKTARTHRNRRFEQTETGVRVTAEKDTKFSLVGKLTLNDDGECRLLVDDKELEFWQFRRRALESFLFDPVL